jgi:hypothetical protein
MWRPAPAAVSFTPDTAVTLTRCGPAGPIAQCGPAGPT